MYNIEKVINEINIDAQTERHIEQIKQFDAIIWNKDFEETSSDIDILRAGNKIFFDKERVFLKYDDETILRRAEERFHVITSSIGQQKFESYCDVGCGHGENPLTALKFGCKRSVGIDINPTWERKSWGTGAQGMPSFFKVDISKKSINEQFDLVTSFWAFEHFENPDSMLEKMGELVNTGGIYTLILHLSGILQMDIMYIEKFNFHIFI